MTFEFATAQRILFGAGTLAQVPDVIDSMGSRVFVLTGKSSERAAPFIEELQQRGVTVEVWQVSGEPTVPMAVEAVAAARAAGCDVVTGFGGGSVVDLGKVVAALLTNDGELFTYLEVVGEGQSIQKQPAPYVAVPTTAGTGAEVTRNAVLGVPDHQRKVSMRSPMMLPLLAVVDPELTYALPPEITAYTGLDALTQVIEPFVSHLANPLTDGFCREGIRRAARSLKRAYVDGNDAEAREDMALASLCGGLALANAKLGAVHGFAGPVGGAFPIPHGVVCGRLLPFVVEVNLQAINERGTDPSPRQRFDELGALLTGDPRAQADEAVTWLQQLGQELDTPPLRNYGITDKDIPELAEKARGSSSMKGNPVELTHQELSYTLQQAL